MNGLDYLLTAFGLLGLILSGAALVGRQPWRELATIALGSVALCLIGGGGLAEQPVVFWAGVVLLAGAFVYEWRGKNGK